MMKLHQKLFHLLRPAMSRVLLPVMLLAVMLMLAGCGSMADPTTWWEDDQGTSIQPNELTKFEQTLKINTLWKENVGSTSAIKQLKLVPRIDGGRVFVANSEGRVLALDAMTGKRLWDVDTELPLSGGPGSGEGLVIVGTSDGDVLAFNEDTGEERWRARVSSEILSVPAAGLGLVIIHTIDGKLFGLDVNDGSQRWLYSRPVPALTLRGSSSPVISGTTVFAGFAGGKLVALDIDSGVPTWELSITAPSGRTELERMVDIDGDPLVNNGVVYVATFQGELAAVGEYTGTLLWRRKLSSFNNMTADWRNVYITDESGQVWGINPDNGEGMWKQASLLNRRVSAPAVIDGYVVVGDFDGYLHWLSHADGSMVARTRLGGDAISSTPVMHNGVVYVLADDQLAAFQPASP